MARPAAAPLLESSVRLRYCRRTFGYVDDRALPGLAGWVNVGDIEHPGEIAWNDELLTGDPQIDWEHRQLVEMLALLRDPAHADDPAYKRVCLDNLLAHVCTHFDHEEQIMRRVGYPELSAHREAHLCLLDQFNRFMMLMENDPEGSPEERIMPFVGRWLLDHIRGDDRRLGEFLRARVAARTVID